MKGEIWACHGTAPPFLSPVGFLASRDLSSEPGVTCERVDLAHVRFGVRVARLVFRALEILEL
jgi:hypothetical protein